MYNVFFQSYIPFYLVREYLAQGLICSYHNFNYTKSPIGLLLLGVTILYIHSKNEVVNYKKN